MKAFIEEKRKWNEEVEEQMKAFDEERMKLKKLSAEIEQEKKRIEGKRKWGELRSKIRKLDGQNKFLICPVSHALSVQAKK